MAAADINLPEEIIIEEILIRLPVKSLARCRCVCKLWNSLSYNPNFVSHFNLSSVCQNPNRENDDDDDDYVICMNDYNVHYTKDSSRPVYGLSILSRNNFSETHMDYNNNNINVVPYPLFHRLIGSINGLVCIASYECSSCHYILWNPIIRFFKKIIAPKHLGFSFADPILDGFGWDSVTNDYKLIIATRSSSKTAVYSCKTDCWSNSIVSLEEYVPIPSPSVIVNGSPYWSRSYVQLSNDDIVKFDVRNNEFTRIAVPSHILSYTLINLNDCLALIQFEFPAYATDVYSFDEQGRIWTKMYTIDKSLNIGEKTLCFKYGGELVFHRKWKLYDPKSHTTKHRRHCECVVKSCNELECPDCRGYLVNGFSYTPSLLALPGMKALIA